VREVLDSFTTARRQRRPLQTKGWAPGVSNDQPPKVLIQVGVEFFLNRFIVAARCTRPESGQPFHRCCVLRVGGVTSRAHSHPA
jgi:hypothetical protein